MLVGHVVAVNDHGVVVDFGAKSEGLVPAQEFADAEQEIRFGPGQTIDVERTDQHKDGYIILSHQRARRRRAWENIEKSYRGKTNIDARVVDRIKGGLVVDIGVRAFLPASQVDLRPVHDLDSWKGREFAVRVLKMNRKRGNVVASRRAILEEEQQTQRQKLMDSLVEGMTLTGKVKNITDYGVFVDLGGIDGLLHITDLSWGRLKHPSEAVQPGDEIEVQVLKFDREKNRVSLGRKQLIPDPWAGVLERFPTGGRVEGKVVGITDYGAFIELAPGVEGLVHISEMTWSKRLKHPSKIVTVGDMVEAVVLGVNTEQRRISLGMKQTTPDPWETLAAKYPVGTVVSGRVRNLTEFGAFVEIEEGFDGLVHVSDLSWTTKVKNPSEVLKKGETVEARVLKVDAPNRRVSLGIKQVNDIWANWFKEHKVNSVVRGKVTRITTFGAFVELAAGIEGLCHISEIEDRKRDKGKGFGEAPGGRSGKPGPSGKPAISLVSGNEYDFKIVKVNVEEHKIGLSYRAAQKQVEKREMEEYKSSKSSSTATLGDVFYAKRGSGQ
jgi:small subunit ribosomal protein S1